MEYSALDLRPNNVFITISDIEIELNLLTLHNINIINEKYGNINEFETMIKKNPFVLFDIIWELVQNKNDFKSKKDFKNIILGLGKTSEVSGVFRDALFEIIKRSNPKVNNSKRLEELAKINQLQNDVRTCYGVYYDRIAKRYHYTIDQFFQLTLGQLHLLLNVASNEGFQDIEVQAALQGKKLKSNMKYDDITEETDKKLDDDAQDMLKRLQAEYKNKKG